MADPHAYLSTLDISTRSRLTYIAGTLSLGNPIYTTNKLWHICQCQGNHRVLAQILSIGPTKNLHSQ